METFEIIQTENYSENEDKIRNGATPCIRCGKGVKNEKYFVELVDGALLAFPTNKEADTSDPGYMGLHPIGSECRKYVPKEFINKY